jgi:hypothetical protein
MMTLFEGVDLMSPRYYVVRESKIGILKKRIIIFSSLATLERDREMAGLLLGL